MSSDTIACLLVGTSALASSFLGWHFRCSSTDPLEFKQQGQHLRACFSLSALFCSTATSVGYLVFVVLWLYYGLSGRQPVGAAVILAGMLCSIYAFVGGFFSLGVSRLVISLSSLATLFLWLLAAAAGAAG
jgi:hypothetical protein